jgi:hypothetical protein
MVRGSDVRHLDIYILQHFIYGLELNDGVLVYLCLIVHEIIQLHMKRNQIWNGQICIKLRSTLTVVEVRQVSLPHVVKHLGFL